MRKCDVLIFSLVVILLSLTADGIKLKFASENDCDRHSLDALYYEKYAAMTSESLTEVTEFVSRITDLTSESLISVMTQLPDSESSSVDERKIFEAFKELKNRFHRGIRKMKKNMTSTWESLLAENQELMLDREHSSLDDLFKKTVKVAEVFSHSRSVLDRNMAMVITAIKDIVHNGMKGITTSVEADMKKEDQNVTQDDSEANATEKGEKDALSDEKLLKRKKKEMVEMIVPQFLGKVTLICIEKKVDLEKKVAVDSDDRDSVLDDMYFSLMLIRNRVSVITQNVPQNQENRDLARRNLYLFWAEQANQMYNEKIQKEKTAPLNGMDRSPWADEDKLADALVSLMEQYP